MLKREQKVISANNTGSFSNFTNNKLTCEKGVGALINATGEIITNDKMRASMLNKYFSSVCTTDDGDVPAIDRVASNDVSLDSIVFTPANVAAALNKFKEVKVVAQTAIVAYIVQTPDSLAKILSLVYTAYMSVRRILNAWRHAFITPACTQKQKYQWYFKLHTCLPH